MRLSRHVLAFGLSLAVCATVALGIAVPTVDAQTATPIMQAGPEPGTWWATINDLLFTAVTAIIGIVVPIVGMYVKQWTGERIGQMIQDRIHEAALRAAALALAKAGINPSTVKEPDTVINNPDVLAIGKEYMNETMRETLDKAGVGESTLTDILKANVGKVLAGVGSAIAKK
jgi:hypothetical protein